MQPGEIVRLRYATKVSSSNQGRGVRQVRVLEGEHEDSRFQRGPIITVEDLSDPHNPGQVKNLYVHRISDVEGMSDDDSDTDDDSRGEEESIDQPERLPHRAQMHPHSSQPCPVRQQCRARAFPVRRKPPCHALHFSVRSQRPLQCHVQCCGASLKYARLPPWRLCLSIHLFVTRLDPSVVRAVVQVPSPNRLEQLDRSSTSPSTERFWNTAT